MKIALSQDKYAEVDRGDYYIVSRHKWRYDHGYASTDIAHHKVYMHRFLLVPPSNLHVDHINGLRLDNRRANLRLVTNAQNTLNSSPRRNAAIPYKGVGYSRRVPNAYRARIKVDGREVALGHFRTAELAAEAYNTAALKYHGEFARLNTGVIT